MLFSEAATEYMADKRKRLRATTVEGYESATRCHLLPRWGEREIETITFFGRVVASNIRLNYLVVIPA